MRVPPALAEGLDREGQHGWLAALPATVRDVEARWALSVGEPYEPGGRTAWVAPARRATGEDVVLKVAWRHPEAEHEADGLRVWAGDGAVMLHATAERDDTIVLVLERCAPGTALSSRPAPEQDEVVASLLARLWRPPPPGHRFRALEVMCDQWAGNFEERVSLAGTTLDPGLVRAGVSLFRSLPRAADRHVLLCTDLHAGNVLAAEREPWLVIDPKPYVGDPTYDALQHLLNCGERLHADPPALVRRVAGLLDLDADRLLLWLFARCVVESDDWPGLADLARRLAPA